MFFETQEQRVARHKENKRHKKEIVAETQRYLVLETLRLFSVTVGLFPRHEDNKHPRHQEQTFPRDRGYFPRLKGICLSGTQECCVRDTRQENYRDARKTHAQTQHTTKRFESQGFVFRDIRIVSSRHTSFVLFRDTRIISETHGICRRNYKKIETKDLMFGTQGSKCFRDTTKTNSETQGFFKAQKPSPGKHKGPSMGHLCENWHLSLHGNGT